MKKIFIFSLVGILFSFDAMAGKIEDKVSKLEEDMQVIQRKIYRDELDNKPITSKTSSVPGDVLVRMGDLEEQFRDVNGKVEELEFKLDSINKKLDIINKDFDLRFKSLENNNNAKVKETENKKIESPKKEEIKKEETISKDDKKLSVKEIYDASYKNLSDEKYEEAEKGFKNILDNFPKDKLAGNASYWLGETYYVRKDYKRSAVAFASCYEKYKDGVKGSGCLLKLGLSMENIDKNEEACVAFKSLKEEFPKAEKSMLNRAEKEIKKLKCK